MEQELIWTLVGILITVLGGLLAWALKEVLEMQNQINALRRQRIEIGKVRLPKDGNDALWETSKWTYPPNHERSNDRMEEVKWPVKFKHEFYGPPSVQVALTKLDLGDARATVHRVELEAKDITSEGFDLYFRTWSQSLVFDATATWIAVAEEPLSWRGRAPTKH